MNKTTERMQAEFIALMNGNGFTQNGKTTLGGRPEYSREWSTETQAARYGNHGDRLEISIVEVEGRPGFWITRNGRQEGTMRTYTSPKRAINAMRKIIEYAGLVF